MSAMSDDDDWIGKRVAAYRQAAGLTQRELAERVRIGPNGESCTASYISLIENGHKPVNTRRLLVGLAEGLGVATTDLSPRVLPRRHADGTSYPLERAVPRIRAALDGALSIETAQPHNVTAGKTLVGHVMSARMGCDYQRMGDLLPATIVYTIRLAERSGGDHPGVLRLLVQTMVAASLAIRPLGYIDLAARVAIFARQRAAVSGDPISLAACDYALAQCHLAGGVHGLRRRSLEIADRAANSLDGPEATDETRGWQTMLTLQAGLAAVSLGQDDVAEGYAGTAARLAEHVTPGIDPWLMEPTPANVGVWRVAIAAESEIPERAVHLAARVPPAGLRTVQRRAHLLLHTGHAHHMLGQTSEAVEAFMQADRLAPSELRSRVRVREAVGEILRTARREAGSDMLRGLAQRLGIDPEA